MSASIEIQAPSAAWARAFDRAARWLGRIGGPDAHIEHIGSTAVPGLSAKPIIDILVGLDAGKHLSSLAEKFEEYGFQRGAAANSQKLNLFLSRRETDDCPAINLHLTKFESSQWRDLIRFRDKLRNDPALVLSYEKLKRRLAETSTDLDAYTAGKGEFVAQVLEKGS